MVGGVAQADLKTLDAIECYGESNCTSDADLVAKARMVTARESGCEGYPGGAPYGVDCEINMTYEDWQRTIIVNQPCRVAIYLWTEQSFVGPKGEVAWFPSVYGRQLKLICYVPRCGRGP